MKRKWECSLEPGSTPWCGDEEGGGVGLVPPPRTPDGWLRREQPTPGGSLCGLGLKAPAFCPEQARPESLLAPLSPSLPQPGPTQGPSHTRGLESTVPSLQGHQHGNP